MATAKQKIGIELVVVENFLSHVKGEIITDAEKVAEYLESEFQNHFVKKTASPAPADSGS